MESTTTHHPHHRHAAQETVTTTTTTTTAPPPREKIILRPLVICGPSGVGKGTIIERYMNQHEGKQYFGFTVSHTTRAPRPGEMQGVHYYFTDKSSMEKEIQEGKFLESAHVHENIYGTSLEALDIVQRTHHKFPLLDIDVQGVRSIKQVLLRQQEEQTREQYDKDIVPSWTSPFFLQPTFVFIAPPSFEVLRQRLEHRGTETAQSIEKRSKNAIAEMQYGMEEGNFDSIIVNETVEQAVEQLKMIIHKVYGIGQEPDSSG